METLDAEQLQALDANRLELINLVELNIPSLPLYLSDRTIEISGVEYEDYIHSINGIGADFNRDTGESTNSDIDIVFRNLRFRSYSHLIEASSSFPFDGVGVTVKEVYLYDSTAVTTPRTIFIGELEEARDINLLEFRCKATSRFDALANKYKQYQITKDVYADADPDDIGAYTNIIYGSGMSVRCQAISAGAVDSLTADITASSPGNSGTLVLSDASEFPSAGAFIIQIENEKISIASRSGNTLTLASSGARGYGSTTAAVHLKGSGVFEVQSTYIYLIANHPIKTINSVYVDGVRQVSGYTAYTGQSGDELASYEGKAVIKFTVKPIVVKQVNLTLTDGITVSDNIVVSTSAPSTLKMIPTGGNSEARDQSDGTYKNMYGEGSPNTWTYPSTSYGTISRQFHFAKVRNPCAGSTYAHVGYLTTDTLIPGGATVILGYSSTDSSWDMSTSVYWSSDGSCLDVIDVWKEVEYVPSAFSKAGSASRAGSVTLGGTSSADVVIGLTIIADVDGYQDDGSGTYTGTPNKLIQNTSDVLHHFLAVQLGATSFNTASFSTARTDFANLITAEYTLEFVIDKGINIKNFIEALVFQSRCSLVDDPTDGFTIDVIPTTAPAGIKTIGSGELVGMGAQFTFNKTPTNEIFNDITLRYKQTYNRETRETQWQGTVVLSDSTSQTKFGVRSLTFDLFAVRDDEQASDLAQYLLYKKAYPLLYVDFEVFWHYFGLQRGDTIVITNGIFSGKKFYIEYLGRRGKDVLPVRAIEWWT